MKRIITVLLLIISIGLLSACASADESMEPNNPYDYDYDETLYFNFNTGSYNNTQPNSPIHGIQNYQIEFLYLYEYAMKYYGYEELSDNEITAYNDFLIKLEDLNLHNEEIFTYETDTLRNLFESNSIEINAMDIFTFISIKNLYSDLRTRNYEIGITNFISLFNDTEFTEEETNALSLLLEFYNDQEYVFTYDTFEEVTTFISDNFLEYTEEEITILESGYNLLSTIKNKGETNQ